MAQRVGPAAGASAGRIAVAAGIGNVMEWFDFAVFGFFATTIGHVFVPTKTATSALLSALAVFGVAFVMRPLGGLILGAIGDRAGRRAALGVSVTLMGAATTLVDWCSASSRRSRTSTGSCSSSSCSRPAPA